MDNPSTMHEPEERTSHDAPDTLQPSPPPQPKRILLLCFIHGFKGNDDTFQTFPSDLKQTISSNLPSQHVIESVVYPKYETKGELAQSTEAFLEWLKEQVMRLRKTHLPTPWPPLDDSVSVILIAHSMGGFVAADALFSTLSSRPSNSVPLFPPISGVLTFDTPFNGLARSMFVYGAFSNYSRVSNVFNVMTGLAAAAPAGIARLGLGRAGAAAGAVPRGGGLRGGAALATWQLVAVRSGTVGAIAAGGVAAYVHRRRILEGLGSVRRLNRESVVLGYQSGVDRLGQGLAYINRGNVGKSFAWLSEHFAFVGCLLKQKELNRRLERMASVRGVGIADFYASLGENGYWSGGYFVPERTFCAVPAKDEGAAGLFHKQVMEDAEDEIQAHMSMFMREKNKNYEVMTNEAAKLAVGWFESAEEVWDDPKFAESAPEEEVLEGSVEVDGEVDVEKIAEEAEIVLESVNENEAVDEGELPDASPIDIAAAASLVPLPDDLEEEIVGGEGKEKAAEAKQAYMRYLFGVAQHTGTNLKSYLPSKMQTMGEMAMPKVSMPVSMPSVSMPSMSMPGAGLFSKKSSAGSEEVAQGQQEKKEERPGTDAEVKSEETNETELVTEPELKAVQ